MTATTSFLAGIVGVGFLAALAIAPDPPLAAPVGDHAKPAGAGDFELDVEGVAPICVKRPSDCAVAIEAIRRGIFPDIPAGSRAACIPHPHCFSDDSNTIKGFNR